MALCERCKTLTINEIVENDVLLHPDLSTLKLKAEQGCEFCALCWGALRTVNRAQLDKLLRGESAWPDTDTWTPTIWLRGGHFFDRGSAGAYIDVSCGKAHGVMIDGQREPFSNGQPSVISRLEVYELPKGLSNYRLRGRRYTSDQNPEMYVTMIRDWLRNCLANHNKCEIGHGGAMPTRIIDVGDPADGKPARLIYTEGMDKEYIALSYCWGVIASDILTLNEDTYHSMKHQIAEASLAKTHQEVITLARTLGIQYVWIDALCIIQGDVKDWEHESKLMSQVYGNATLTVIAGRSADSRKGFITNALASKGRPPPCKLPIGMSENFQVLVVDLPRAADIGPVSTRGWCFQERLSCRRSVIFGDEQLIFECVTDVAFENGKAHANQLRPVFLRPSTLAAAPEELLSLKDQSLREWYQLLNMFVKCHLSNPHDIFAAIAAISRPASHILESRYLAGIWECDIVRGLLWRPCYHFQTGPSGKIPVTRPKATKLTKETGAVVRAPSWSWAAVEGPVAQESYSPPSIARHKDPAYRKVHPRHTNPARWTLSDHCSVGTLHMPTCELQLLGHITQVKLTQIAVSEYLQSRPKWAKVAKWAARENGVLLTEKTGKKDTLGESERLDQVVAVGFFDVAEERQGVEEVWCLLIVRDKGLMLKRNTDESFSRIGWFLPENDKCLMARKEVVVRLC